MKRNSGTTLTHTMKITEEDRKITTILKDKYAINVSVLLRNTIREKYHELEENEKKK